MDHEDAGYATFGLQFTSAAAASAYVGWACGLDDGGGHALQKGNFVAAMLGGGQGVPAAMDSLAGQIHDATGATQAC